MKLLVTAGVATLGAVAIAYFIHLTQTEISENKDEIEALQTRYTTLKTNYDDELDEDQSSICSAVSVFLVL